MVKIAIMMSAEDADALMSEHFGKAECIMVSGEQGESAAFLPNDTTNGHNAAGIIHQNGCTSVIVTGIGAGAVAWLKAAGIRVWGAPRGISGTQALELFRKGALPELAEPTGHEHGGGCCGSGAHEGRSSCCSH
ncbi:MAG: NifB/NifX family molybdenum-iron cluster-binding protein [Terracidiphilus sp.]|nr:NifB/NifX family molybdenum-iron cluster-binding protein [Terracidiphilus sp.]